MKGCENSSCVGVRVGSVLLLFNVQFYFFLLRDDGRGNVNRTLERLCGKN